MYFFSSRYIQINNNTKIKIKILVRITPLALGLEPLVLRHFEIKSLVLVSEFKLESSELSFENLD